MDIEPKNVQSLQDMVSARRNRVAYRFTLPQKVLGYSNGLRAVGLVALTPAEEMMAAKRCGNITVRLAWEQAIESLREIAMEGPKAANGEVSFVWKNVSMVDGSANAAWGQMDPKVRNLVLLAFSQIHNPDTEDLDAFLDSREITVG